MLVWEPLKHKAIARLWMGQALSFIGDELYKVALIWLAVDLVGYNAGYVSALQSLAIVFFGVVGGNYAERLNHRKTMIWSDIIRGIVVLIPPIAFYFYGPSLWSLLPVAIIVASLYIFFDPALQATIPVLAPKPDLLQATNGLFGSTPRMARVFGPSLVGILSRFVSPIHFFTINAITFFASAYAIKTANWEEPIHPPSAPVSWKKFWKNFRHSLKLAGAVPIIRFGLFSSAWVWGTWTLGFTLGIALLVQKDLAQGLDTYAFILLSYGIGNLTSNLIWGSIPIRKPERLMFLGELLMGCGFIIMAYSPTLSMLAIFAGIAASGGPMDDLSFQTLLQRHYSGKEMAAVYRLFLIGGHSSILFFLLLSPTLFHFLGIRQVIALCGFLMVLVSLIGLRKFGFNSPNHNRARSLTAS